MTEIEYKRKLKNKLINYRDFLNLPKDLTFGIEIEYENIVNDSMNYYLEELIYYNPKLKGFENTCEIDIAEYNALGEEMNGEIVSPILTDSKETWKDLEEILTMLNSKGAIITNKCGGHVNIGIHILENNIEYFKNLILLWLLYRNKIEKFATGEYRSIRRFKDKHFISFNKNKLLEDVINPNISSIYDLDSSFFDKNHEIFLHRVDGNRILKDDVIEFRIPNGTLNPEVWQNYINFFAKFIMACKKELDMEKAIYDIKNNNGNIISLINYVFDNSTDKQNFLIQALKTNEAYKRELPKHIIYKI